jgi:hypothetical protein
MPDPQKPQQPAGKSIGIYCLANDGVIEWFEMFARSLRHFHPTLPLTVIPYNSQTTRLEQLTSKYRFDLIPEAEVAQFEALEPKIMNMNRHAGMFRKWASFFGPYDEFILFDADIAIAMPLGDIFSAFATSGCDFLYFDTDITMVYRPEHVAAMQAKYGSPGFNAGTFGSRKGVITWELLWQMADKAAADRHLFEPMQVDQPFLNYVFDTLPRRMTSLHALLPELSPKPWARVPFRLDHAHDRAVDGDGRQMPFIHWAGYGFPTMIRPEIFLNYRTLGMTRWERLLHCVQFYLLRWKRTIGIALRRAGLKK